MLWNTKYSELKIVVNWEKAEDDVNNLMAVMDEGRTKKFNILEELLPWLRNKVPIIIPSVKAEDIKYLSFKMYTNNIYLRSNWLVENKEYFPPKSK